LDDQHHDIDLMRRIGQGDAGAYRVLSERHLHAILRYATRLLHDATEAEDVTQETFLKLWTSADTWQPDAKLSTWLHRIAHNLCIDRLRRRRGGEDETELVDETNRPSDLMARKQTAQGVEHALANLPARQRAAVVLVHYQGLGNPEAADVLGIGVEAVESLLSRARRSLREALAGLHAEETST
jgi:RNA polymerase sigma-70 factor (ECF subfamily)